jgi:hypothetical protein
MQRGQRMIEAMLLVTALVLPAAARASTASALDWCAHHTRMPSCPAEFLAVAPQCLASGFRACLIDEGRQAAADGNCGLALRLARTCQCHSPATRDAMDEATVCDWLLSN